jgi:hypothetical protein
MTRRMDREEREVPVAGLDSEFRRARKNGLKW